MQCGLDLTARCFPELEFVILHLPDDFANYQATRFTHFTQSTLTFLAIFN